MRPAVAKLQIVPRLWIYTNFDCNLQCSYCVARSSPRAERRGLAYFAFTRLVDEAADYGIREVFVTGGEPFLLPDIGKRLSYAAERIPTTVLTNAMLFRGQRLETMRALAVLPNLVFQVSLDGPDAATHDAYRGSGAWMKSVEGIRTLLAAGAAVAIGSTETPINVSRLDELRCFVASLGIPEERHFIRPLARRGFAVEGMDLGVAELVPEITASLDGIFWHPLACEDDLLVTRRLFPLAAAMEKLEEMYRSVLAGGALPRPFR
ncbi:MAG: radical SAM protein [Dehalococcoidia bacterium]